MKISIKKLFSSILAVTMVCGLLPTGTIVMAQATTITVGKGSGYDFSTVQSAIDSIKIIPTEKDPVTIEIASGTYEESVSVNKPNVHITHDGKPEEVVITYDKANGHSNPAKNFGTDNTSTFSLGVNATGFKADNITVQNSYNIGTNNSQVQAVAFSSQADKVVLNNCRLIGRQDTLYLRGASKGQTNYGSANSVRTYLKNCYIEGTVDYIFGDGTAFFDKCNLKMMAYQNGGHFTAPNTTLFNIGYVFNECNLSVDKTATADILGKIDLGRPWQCDGAYPSYGSNSVFINCTLPDNINKAGFSKWDENTVLNKVRFYEYNSKDSKGRTLDTKNRAEFVKELTEKQAKQYNCYNVLKGEDGWNPALASGTTDVCDITLNGYNLSMPVDETYTLKAFTLPVKAKTKVTYTSSDENIASVDNNGVVKAKVVGECKITATTETGMSATANVTVTAERTALPTLKSVSIEKDNSIRVGQKLKAVYSYNLDTDNEADAANIRWYAVDGSKKILIKEGVGEYFQSYEVEAKDVGYNIMVEVMPATKTTYGEYGATGTYTTKAKVTGNSSTPNTLYRSNFDSINGWTTKNKWNIISNGYNNFVTAGCENGNTCLMTFDKGTNWNNVNIDGRFRFNPDGKGLTSEGFFNIYMNYNTNSYYKLTLGRGSNTKSVKLYIYKNDGTGEVLLGKDETSLKNNIYQNSGEGNPYFYVTFAKTGDNLTAKVRFEGQTKPTAILTAKETGNALSAGTVAMEAGGDANIVLVDSLSVESAEEEDDSNKTRIFILGDSTVKYYGDDNTIGGWGEYLVNYFNADSVKFINKAEGGRSTRSFINQGRLAEAMSEVRKGDYVFIQFGTNDQRTDANAFMEHSVALGTPDTNEIYPTVPGVKSKTPDSIYNFYKDTDYPYAETFYSYNTGTFKWYLDQYVTAVRQAGGVPVLLTPACRIFFDSNGKITSHFGENDGYVTAVRQVAEEQKVELIDMFNITKDLYESYGVFTTQGLHNIKEDGTVDLTHYNKFGANLIAGKMADAIKSLNLSGVSENVIASNKEVAKTDSLKSANLVIVGSKGVAGDNEGNYRVDAAGFGNYIGNYLSDKITVKNLAQTDATAKSFSRSDKYNEFLNSFKEGDYVMIAFTNEDKYTSDDIKYYSSPYGNVDTTGSYEQFLYYSYVKPVLDKKAIPILVTPYYERTEENGELTATENPYVNAVKDLVVSKQLFFVNMYDLSKNLYDVMGAEGSKVLNAYDANGKICGDTFSTFGAETMAKKILTALKQSSASLKDYINDTKLTAVSYMTRADFTYMVIDALGCEINNGNSFADVSKGKYYQGAIATAKNLGLVTAVDGNNFHPEEPVTADFLQSVIDKALKYKKSNADFKDVYALAKGKVSNEIGIYAIDKLNEEINK